LNPVELAIIAHDPAFCSLKYFSIFYILFRDHSSMLDRYKYTYNTIVSIGFTLGRGMIQHVGLEKPNLSND